MENGAIEIIEKVNFITQYNFTLTEDMKCKDFGVSLAIPNQSLSIKEIIRRYENNTLPSTIYKDPTYDSGCNFDTEDDFISDLTDIDEGRLALDQMLSNLETDKTGANSEHEHSEGEESAPDTEVNN